MWLGVLGKYYIYLVFFQFAKNFMTFKDGLHVVRNKPVLCGFPLKIKWHLPFHTKAPLFQLLVLFLYLLCHYNKSFNLTRRM